MLRLPERQRGRDHGPLQRDAGHAASDPSRHVRLSRGEQGAAGGVRYQEAGRIEPDDGIRVVDSGHLPGYEFDSGEIAAARNEDS